MKLSATFFRSTGVNVPSAGSMAGGRGGPRGLVSRPVDSKIDPSGQDQGEPGTGDQPKAFLMSATKFVIARLAVRLTELQSQLVVDLAGSGL